MALTEVLSEVQSLFPPDNDIWYILAAVVIVAFNQPKDIAILYKLIEQTIEKKIPDESDKLNELVRVTLRLREGIFKSLVGSGFPKVIHGLDHLRQATPDAVLARLPTKRLRAEDTFQDIVNQREEGRKLFSTIYQRFENVAEKNMDSYYPDLAQTALNMVYGTLLSGTTVLTGKETSLLLATTLCAFELPTQLRSHTHGALNQGATKEDVDQFHKLVNALRLHYSPTPGPAKL